MAKVWQRCPLRGCRAPDLAAGDLFEELQSVLDIRSQRLLANLPATLGPEQRADLLQEFERARSHLCFTFTVKLSHWGIILGT